MTNLERCQMPGDVSRIKGRPGKRTDGVGGASRLALLAQGGVIEVRAEHPHCRFERLRLHRRLSPSHHLCVEPSRLRWIRPRRALATDQQIAAALAPRSVRRNLQTAIEGALNHLRIDADPLGLWQDTRCF